jgi:molybdopterin-guanine dinucleotide biosynthesis protein B/molybdopterin-guanine dinucleotide biosynthesis protein
MGTDKASLPVMRGTMLDFVIRRYSEVFSNVILSCDQPGRYDFPGVTQIYDKYPDSGPMAGLHAVFSETDAEQVFLTGVDIPFASPQFAAWLYDSIGGAPARGIRYGGFLEPLYAAYSRKLFSNIENFLRDGDNSLLNLLDTDEASIIEEDELTSISPYPPEELLININSPGDYERALPLFKYYGDTKKPVISVVAKSGTGKTTYLERLIPELKKRGLTLGVIKHDAHKFEIDIPGKDSWRIAQAGADIVAVSSSEKTAVIEKHEQPVPLNKLVRRMRAADLILTEGYKTGFKPKIEIRRAELGNAALCADSELIAVVSDDGLSESVPVLPFAELSAMADLIEEFVARFRPL